MIDEEYLRKIKQARESRDINSLFLTVADLARRTAVFNRFWWMPFFVRTWIAKLCPERWLPGTIVQLEQDEARTRQELERLGEPDMILTVPETEPGKHAAACNGIMEIRGKMHQSVDGGMIWVPMNGE